ncbi:MAG TPA: MYXO-CTERM sorting domain-containing protein [Byssovorax sp.]|jgi:MYXO-CTERM domain-containing protein
MRVVRSLALAVVMPLVAVGCSLPPDDPPPTAVDRAPIINGQRDTTDDAVVAVLSFASNGYTECSGTIISTNGTTGYVLTAAHCCPSTMPPQIIARGDYYLPMQPGDPNVTSYQVLQYLAHPSYVIGGNANQPFDFCMITFAGEANMPVIPAMTSATDDVTTGSAVTQIGYGQTTVGPEGSDNNTYRNEVQNHVAGLETAYQAVYPESPGGTCFGDSGGPDVAPDSNGQLAVYGVHSNVYDDHCDPSDPQSQNVSGVVSKVYDDFIATYLAGTPPVQDCDGCVVTSQGPGGSCSAETATCGANPDCVNLIDCANPCTTNTCVQDCANANPAGVADYNALLGCLCEVSSCGDVCMCAPTSTTTATSSAAGFMTSSSSSGAGGAGGSAEATSSSAVTTGPTTVASTGAVHPGSAAGAGGADAASESDDSGGCATTTAPASNALGFALGLAALALARRRRSDR